MNVTHDQKNIKLTAGEISELFNAYLNNSASICVLSYFVEKAKDPDVKSILQTSLDASRKILERISDIFQMIKHPIPQGFSPEDVNIKAKKLYSDEFMLTYVRFMARFGLTNYSEARACFTCEDVRNLVNDAIRSTLELLDTSDKILLEKGLYVKEPVLPIPERIDFVEKQSFLNGFLGEKRPLNALEINRLYLLFSRNALGKAFLMGLCQTISDKEIKDYLLRGQKISEHQMEKAGAILLKEDLPIPPSLDSEVTDSTESVFSDKLIMFHVAALNGLGLGVTGISLSRVMRRDLSANITGFMGEIALYGEDGFNILINRKWFERIPEAADRKELLGL